MRFDSRIYCLCMCSVSLHNCYRAAPSAETFTQSYTHEAPALVREPDGVHLPAQATLWSMPRLLQDVTIPVSWMERLRIHDLNVWLGDGLFRNTLHNDPQDNFLCLIHGAPASIRMGSTIGYSHLGYIGYLGFRASARCSQ